MALIPTRLDSTFRDKVSKLRADLSKKNVTYAVLVTNAFCTNCIYDHTNKCGSGTYKTGGPKPFDGRECPVCDNAGKTSVERPIRLTATVTFMDDKKGDQPFIHGTLPAGSIKIKVDPQMAPTLLSASHFMVNGKRFRRVSSDVKKTGLLTPATASIYCQLDE
jgi:hypothetical protein